jgi:hypothetical protein
MTIIEIAITALPFAAGAWAAWALPRWAGEGRSTATPETSDWTYEGLPSRPYRDLRRVG